MRIYQRLFDEIRPHWKLAAAGMGFSVAMAVLDLVPALLVASLVDNAITGKNSHLLHLLCGLLFFTLLCNAGAFCGRTIYAGKLGQVVLAQLRTRLYEHLQKLSMSFYDNRRTGQIMSRVTSDVSVLEQFIVGGIRDLVVNSLKLVIIAAILIWRNPTLALLTLLPTVPLYWGTRYFNKRIKPQYKMMSRRMADMNSILSDTITGIREVQVFTQEDTEAGKFRRKSDEFQQAGLNTQYMLGVFYPSVVFTFGVGQVIVWLWGGNEVLHGRLTPGELIMFASLVAQFYSPVQVLSQMSNLLASTVTSGERVYEILDIEPAVRTSDNAVPMSDVKGEVVFDNVSFGYDSSEPIIQNLSLTVNAGETIGLVGPSGSGKSTLASLVTRFYDVNDGSVKVDGEDVRDLNLQELRGNISVVLQEPYLFHGTIAENIAYGRPKARFEEIIDAATSANSHEFIMDLPDAYDTHVGERGTKLSGGQRQRISIARAILNDPKILILDEATSAVDTVSEVQIQTALDNLMQGRTTLAIAHRLSTVRDADKLVVMEAGKIVETGTHDELMGYEDGLYKKLVDMQNKLAVAGLESG